MWLNQWNNNELNIFDIINNNGVNDVWLCDAFGQSKSLQWYLDDISEYGQIMHTGHGIWVILFVTLFV